MEAEGISDDEISLTSTVESEQQSEYEVETILAEEEFPDGMRFLVRWLGYSLDRCTWEPAGNFNFSETLQDWEQKKQQISEGKEPAFDVAAWEARLVRLQGERDERKRKRLVKRRKFTASEANCNSTPVKRALNIRRTNSNKISNGSNPGPTPRSLFRDEIHPARQGLLGSSAQRLPPILFGTSLATPVSARPKKTNGTDKPKLFKNLSTKWKHEKLGRAEPAPDKNQLDLRRPAEWASMSSTDITQLGPSRLVTDIADDRQMEYVSSAPVESPQSSQRYQRSPAASPIPNNDSWKLSNPEQIETPSELINIPAVHNGSARPASEFDLEFPARIPERTSRFVNSRRWWNRGELYVSMYFGPEKLEIGDVRLCGIPFEKAKGIFKMKVGKIINLWFKDLCTLGEYNALCHGLPNKKVANGWIEGFDDTEPTIRKAAKSLWQANQVAIAHINGGSWNEILLAYPPRSPDFNFLDADTSLPERGYLHLTLRSPLGPMTRLTSGSEIYPHLRELNNTSNDGSLEPTTMNAPSGVKPPHSMDVAQENTKLSTTCPTLDLPDSAIYTQSPSPDSPTTPIISGKYTVHKDRPSTESMDHDARPTQAPAPGQVGPNIHAAPNLDELLSSKFGISFKKLATIGNTDKPQRAEMFFVWFPDDSELVRNEKELILAFLRNHTSLLYSNSVGVDWERFVTMVKKNTMQGVVLFHESFVHYESVPFLKDVLRKSPAFWNISISQPLKYAGRQVHAQRLFPHGGVILLTEDFMVREPDATTIILGWFCEYTRTKLPGNWKIMVRPDIFNWALKQVEVSDKSKKPWWLAISHLLERLGLSPTDGRLPSIEDEHSSVISPSSLPRYGSRTSDDCPTIPSDWTQEQRNTDHLAEFFAGWSIANAHRFRRFSMVTALEPLQRWKNWQHIDIKRGSREFYQLHQIDPKRIHATILQEAPGSSAVEPLAYTPRTPMPPCTPVCEQQTSSSVAQPLFRHTYGQPYQ